MRFFPAFRIFKMLPLLLAGVNGCLWADTFGVTSAGAEIFNPGDRTFVCIQGDVNFRVLCVQWCNCFSDCK